MNCLIHPTYVDPDTKRRIMTADSVQVVSSVSSTVNPSNGFSMLNQTSISFDSLNSISPVFSPIVLDLCITLASRVSFSDEISQTASNINTYSPPPVVEFSGDPANLVIDRTKALELKANTNDAIASSLGEEKSMVAVDKLSTDNGATNDEHAQSTPPLHPQGSKRKSSWLEDKENSVNDKKTGVVTKRRKNVLRDKNENKKTTTASGSKDEQKSFACPECGRRFKRRSNMNSHIKTHQPSRVKKFPCSDCDKSFTRKHDCTRHQANIHG